jgi:HSP20 family protein
MFNDLSSFENIFDEFNRIERQMDDLFSQWPWPAGIRSVPRGSFPPINVGATPEAVDIYVFGAGVDPKNLTVSIQQNLLTISGERQVPVREDVTYYRQERFGGEFRRVITLPEDVDPAQVDAQYRDGIVQIHAQRRESSKPRQIEVK